jgi:hypothetical protein
MSTTLKATDADIEVSAVKVAVTVTLDEGGVEGAVYSPVPEIVPQAAPLHPVPERPQVTAVLLVPVTVAVNC